MPSVLGPREASLDSAALQRLRLILRQEEEMRALLREFLASSGQLVNQAEWGLARGRAKEVELAAHTLKSMAKLVGANDLAEASRLLEFAAHGSSAKAIPARLVKAVAGEVTRAQEAVARLLV